uniref:Glutaredoxin domain-containing protein n=1 Tax=viral metagenome TaxID=1070528 RepID=A0A6C0D8S2_9ZZZZ
MEETFVKPEEKAYTIYSKSGCPNCIKVKNFLQEKKQSFRVIDCDDYLIEDKELFLNIIQQLANKSVKTFPMVFHNGKFVGGFEDTINHFDVLNAFSDTDF